MLFLNQSTIQQTDWSIIQSAVQTACEKMLNQDINISDRIHLKDRDNILLLMPCFSKDYFATKLLSAFPGAKELGAPIPNGMVLLCSNESGQPLAILDGASLTSQRTEAVGGLAISYLTHENAPIGGLFGAGVQGLNLARYLLYNRNLSSLFVFDLDNQMMNHLIRSLEDEFKGIEFFKASSPAELLQNSDIIIAATTSSKPVFEAEHADIKGKTFISIGSFKPQMQKFPSIIIQTADRVYVDTLSAAQESGDIASLLAENLIPENKIIVFSELLKNNPYLKGQTVLFKSVGMAAFDLTVSIAIYEFAKEKNLGQVMMV